MLPDEIRQPPRAWAEQRLELYWAYTGSYPQGMPKTRHALAPFRIWGVRQGAAEVAYADTTICGVAGDWLLLPALMQRQRIAPGTILSSLALDSPMPGGVGLLRAIRPQRLASERSGLPTVADGLLAWAAEHAVRLPNQRMRLPPMTAAVYGELQTLLSRLAGVLVGLAPAPATAVSTDPRLRHLWTMLAAHATAAFPPVPMMESCTGLGWRRLEQLCRRDWGQSPREIHQCMRLAEALRLLDDHAQPIKSLARALGFAGPDRFSHWLRRTTGRSPQQWRGRTRC